ncbi:MAG: 50S ribosomal protein L22 [archaeon]
MVKRHYNFAEYDSKKQARAFISGQPVSLKFSNEMCRELKGMNMKKAEAYLKRVSEMKDFLPLRVYSGKVAHRKGNSKSFVKAGRYPIRLAKVFLGLLNLVKANADFKGLDSDNLVIVHTFCSQGFRKTGYQTRGRISGKRHRHKSTHLEIIVEEAS